MAWASPETVPRAWVEQAAPGAVLITPVEITALVKTTAVLHARVRAEGRLAAESLSAGGYVEMHEQVPSQWLMPPRGVDALVHAADDAPWWDLRPLGPRQPDRRDTNAHRVRQNRCFRSRSAGGRSNQHRTSPPTCTPPAHWS